MKISTNQFTKKVFNKVSGTWSDAVTASSNTFSKKQFKTSENAWEGANTSATAFGVDEPLAGLDSTYGAGALGGFAHFKLRDDYDVTH